LANLKARLRPERGGCPLGISPLLPLVGDSRTHLEAHQFLEAVREKIPEYYPFFLCALRTGIRLGELLALQWGDVDVTGRFLEVRRNLVAGRLTSTKNTNRRRVDMSLKLTETLRELHRARKAASLKAGKPVPQWVFINSDGTALDGDNVRHRVFYRLLESAKLREIRFHDLRHTFASLLIQNGAPLTYVKEQMGHSSIQVTVDVYGHLVPSANRAEVDRLDAIPIRNPDATGDGKVDQQSDANLLTAKGAGARTRTEDLLITNQLLYQLSYAGIVAGPAGSVAGNGYSSTAWSTPTVAPSPPKARETPMTSPPRWLARLRSPS
jgi:hypothetical protein